MKIGDLTKKSTWKVTGPIQTYTSMYLYTYSRAHAKHIINPDYVGDILQNGETVTFVSKVSHFYAPFTLEASVSIGQLLVFIHNNKEIVVAFNDVKDKLELLEQPKDLIYVIHDPVNGFYKAQEDTHDTTHRAGSSFHDGVCAYGRGSGQQTVNIEIKWSKTPASGKVMKTLAQAKQRLLYNIGYFNDAGENAPGMLYNYTYLNSIPESWSIMSYDKVSKELTTICNAKEYVDNALRLKKLTVKYGSAVRNIYNKLEKDSKMEEFTHVVVWNTGSALIDDKSNSNLVEYSNGNHHDGETFLEIKKEFVDGVKKSIGKAKYKNFTNNSCAVAVTSRNEALKQKLAYIGPLNCTAIDIKEMAEVAE